MGIEKIRRWQWMVIAVVLGFIISGVRQTQEPDPLSKYGNTLNTQELFEMALLRDEQGIRFFKDIVVYPVYREQTIRPPVVDKKAPPPRERTVKYVQYVVGGKYYSGRPERTPDGQFKAYWRPYCFVTPMTPVTPTKETPAVPYKPTAAHLAQLQKLTGKDYSARFNKPDTTVLDYLEVMKEARNVTYKYAWWQEPKKAMALWVGGTFVVVGLIWPSLIYLIAFGSLVQPPVEKGIDLSKVENKTTGPVAATGPTQEQLSEVEQYEKNLEKELASKLGDEPAGARPATPPTPQPTVIKPLTAQAPVEPILTQEQKEAKEFGAKQDDFYPTERHARPHKPTG